MAAFYVKMAALATKLVKKFGADVQLVKENRDPADVNKPHRGNDTPDTVVIVKGAITFFEDEEVDGDIIRRGDLGCWIGAVAGQDISTFDFCIDNGGTRFKIENVLTIKPAALVVAYRLQLRA